VKITLVAPRRNHPNDFSLTKDELVSALKLATMWYFLEIRDFAITKLTSTVTMDDIEKIVLGKKYSVTVWLRSGITALARRRKHLTLEEAGKIGLEPTVKIFQLREQSALSSNSYIHGSSSPYDHVNIEAQFSGELKEAEQNSAVYRRAAGGVTPGPPALAPNFKTANQTWARLLAESGLQLREGGAGQRL